MGDKVYIKGKALYLQPYKLDTGDNLPEGSDIKNKIMRTEGIYSTRVVLPFDNRDDAEEYLNSIGIPTNGMMGNLLKKETDAEGNKIITYKVTRPHMEPNFPDPFMGPPAVFTTELKEHREEGDNEKFHRWDPEVLIGNGSDITVKVDVWKGDKATKIRWESIQVTNLVGYEAPEGEGF